MDLRILTLNCGTKKESGSYGAEHIGGLKDLLTGLLAGRRYDFILLQEYHEHFSGRLAPGLQDYQILTMPDEEAGVGSELAILYRKSFTLKEGRFHSFAGFRKKFNSRWPGIFGLLLGRFQTPAGEWVVGSTHLNPLLHFATRKKEVRFVKKCLLQFAGSGIPLILGGDFNSGLPGEKARNDAILAPEFVNATAGSGPTVDSRYVEPVIWPNKLAVSLGRLGIVLRMKVDHIYIDRKTAMGHDIACKVLPDRVSDHSPVEVSLRG